VRVSLLIKGGLMKKVTIKDVADAAGVSYVTVSNAINNKGRMTEETKQKVLACIKKMNFHPDGSARALVSGKSNTIAFISGYLSSPFVTGILAGVERQLYDKGNFDYILAHISIKVSQAIKQKIIDDMIYGKKADAVIMLTVKPDDKHIKEFKKHGIPLVLIENDAVAGANSIKIDNRKGSYLAVDYLLNKGKRKIALVSGPSGNDGIENNIMMERQKGYEDALKNKGLETEKKRMYNTQNHRLEEGIRLLDAVLADNPDTDAVFSAAGDFVAVGIMHRAKELGIKIPQDISLVGYDDIPIAGLLNPSLTTVSQQLDVIGRKALDLAMDSLTGKIHGTHEIQMAPELIIRESA
jgi:DNA-binding LacI/PurR family transcriptional regulator